MPSLIYIGSDGGLFRLESHSRQWEVITLPSSQAAVLAVRASDRETIQIRLKDDTGLQSFDEGAHWLTDPQPIEPVGLQVMTALGPRSLANPRLAGASAYARLASKPSCLLGAGAGGMMMFRSEDDGIHWEAAQLPSEQLGMITSIVPDALEPRRAWAGSTSGALLSSGDAGLTWVSVALLPAAIRALVSVEA